jgi:hypothetical protein
MTRDDIIRLAREAGWHDELLSVSFTEPLLERFAALVAAPLEEEIKRLRFCIPEGDAAAAMEYLAYCVEKDVAAERGKVAKWMIERSYATGHGDTVEDLLKELEWQAKERGRGDK